jgi:hypothetical protein
MAGFLSLYNQTERIEVADGYWVDIKTNLTTEEYEAAQRVLIGKVSMRGAAGIQSEPDTIAYQRALVSQSIVGWNLTDEADQPLPLEPEQARATSISRLPQSVFLAIYERVNASSAPRTTDEEISFRDGGPVSPAGD